MYLVIEFKKEAITHLCKSPISIRVLKLSFNLFCIQSQTGLLHPIPPRRDQLNRLLLKERLSLCADRLAGLQCLPERPEGQPHRHLRPGDALEDRDGRAHKTNGQKHSLPLPHAQVKWQISQVQQVFGQLQRRGGKG